MTDLDQGSWAVTGALSVAPRSIQFARDALILLLLVTGSFSAIYLGLSQILSFVLGLIFLTGFVFWRICSWQQSIAVPSSFEVLRVTDAGIGVVGCPTPLVLEGMIRHWAGITLLCQCKINNRLVARRVTLWQDQFKPEQYRRLHVLLNWLIRGQA